MELELERELALAGSGQPEVSGDSQRELDVGPTCRHHDGWEVLEVHDELAVEVGVHEVGHDWVQVQVEVDYCICD